MNGISFLKTKKQKKIKKRKNEDKETDSERLSLVVKETHLGVMAWGFKPKPDLKLRLFLQQHAGCRYSILYNQKPFLDFFFPSEQ